MMMLIFILIVVVVVKMIMLITVTHVDVWNDFGLTTGVSTKQRCKLLLYSLTTGTAVVKWALLRYGYRFLVRVGGFQVFAVFSGRRTTEAVRKVCVRAVRSVARMKEVPARTVPLRRVSEWRFLQLVALEERGGIMFQTWRLLRRRPVRRRSERQTAFSLHCEAPSACAGCY